MRTIQRTRATAMALLLIAVLSACSDAGKQLAIAAKTNLEVQKFAIEAQKQGRMSLAETKVIVDATDRIGKAGLSAVAIVEAVKAGDPASKAAALNAVGLIADEIGKILKELSIKDETSRRNVEGLLIAMQTSLNSARVIIASTK